MEGVRVCLLDAPHCLLQRIPNVCARGANIPPVTAFGDLKPVILREPGILHITIRLQKGDFELFVVDGADSPEEKQRKNVSFEVGRIDRPPQNVGSFPKMTGKCADIQKTVVAVSFRYFVHINPFITSIGQEASEPGPAITIASIYA